MSTDQAVVDSKFVAKAGETPADSPSTVSSNETVESLKIQVDKLDKRMSAFADTHKALLDANQVLRDTNHDILEVIDAKRKRYRDYWPIAFGILTFSIAATLGYQIFKATEITQMIADARSDRAKQSQLAGDLTQAIVLLSLGYRDDARERHGAAFRRAEEATAIFKRWEPYVDALNRPETSRIFTSEQSAEFSAVRNLLPAAEEALLASYELQGRAGFFLMNSENPEVANRFLTNTDEVGRRIMELDDSRWTGPHFLALALDKASKSKPRQSPERLKLQAQAENLYVRSVELDPKEGSLDLLNYAEAQLMEGNFGKAIKYTERYLALDTLAPHEHLVACFFIQAVAKYALSNSEQDKLNAQNVARKVARTRFRNYNWSDYKTLLEPDSPLVVHPVSAPYFKQAWALLLNRVCVWLCGVACAPRQTDVCAGSNRPSLSRLPVGFAPNSQSGCL